MGLPVWIAQELLAAGERPGYAYDRDLVLGWLEQAGVRRVFWLSEREPDLPEEIEVHHLPVEDYHPPSVEVVRLVLAGIGLRLGPAYLCCDAGKGRTGTVAACFLVSRGMTPVDALIQVRRLILGAVETPAQEVLVRSWSSLER